MKKRRVTPSAVDALLSRKPSARQVLAVNVNRLMESRPDVGTTIRLARASKVGNGTIGRIRNGTVACTIDTVQAIAQVFGIDVWQLLVPEFDPRNPPILRGASQAEREFYEKLEALLAARVDR